MNNPINFIDLKGEDAIWLNDSRGAFFQGHASLLIKDSDGTWFHINFGPHAGLEGGANRWGIITKEVADLPSNITIQNGQVTNSRTDYRVRDLRANSGMPRGLERYFDSDNDFHHYIRGDFTASLERAKYYVENQSPYNLLGNNCAWFSLYVLQASFEQGSETYNNIHEKLWRDNLQFWNDSQNRHIIRPNSFTGNIEELFPQTSMPLGLATAAGALLARLIGKAINNLLQQSLECEQ